MWPRSDAINVKRTFAADKTSDIHAKCGIFTITRLCNIMRFFTAVKMTIFSRKSLIFFLFLLKTQIKAVLTSSHNLCFRAKIRRKNLPF